MILRLKDISHELEDFRTYRHDRPPAYHSGILATGMTVPQSAMAQNPGDQVALLCRYEGYGTLQYFYTDIIMIPKAITRYTPYGDPVDDRPFELVLPEFKAHLT